MNQDVKVEKYAGSYLNFSLNAYLSANIADEKRTGIVGDSSIEILFDPRKHIFHTCKVKEVLFPLRITIIKINVMVTMVMMEMKIVLRVQI